MTVDAENDKSGVIALREIAEKTVDPRDVREGFIHAMQNQAEVDEPEPTSVPTLPHAGRPAFAPDNPSTDTVVEATTEDELLRHMGSLTPIDAHTRGDGGA